MDELSDDTYPSVLDCICYAAVTEAGTIIPWLCHTDPQFIESELRRIGRGHWRVERVRIEADE